MIMVVFLALFFSFLGYEIYISYHSLICTNYEIYSEKVNSGVRIVQLSDLHNNVFGEENAKLAETVRQQSPDLILLTGDMLNLDDEDYSVAAALIRKLREIAPVYFSYGNHEAAYEINFNADLTALFEEAGAVVLEKTFEDIEVNGQKLRLGGIYGYCLPEELLKTGEADPEECAFLTEFQDTEAYTVLLCHMPVSWILYGSLEMWDVDCIFAGHAHGGQVRLPWIGGLYAPDQGWFPGNAAGVYESRDGKKTLVLSRGLGSGGMIPRFNNKPELVVTDILPAVQE